MAKRKTKGGIAVRLFDAYSRELHASKDQCDAIVGAFLSGNVVFTKRFIRTLCPTASYARFLGPGKRIQSLDVGAARQPSKPSGKWSATFGELVRFRK